MRKFTWIKRKYRRHLISFILIIVAGYFFSSFSREHQYPSANSGGDTLINFKSALKSITTIPTGDTLYTIHICTLTELINDSLLNGKYKIKPLRMGNAYRYIFSEYTTLEKARIDLMEVKKIYPKAFIREYNQHKLGKAIDLNIDYFE